MGKVDCFSIDGLSLLFYSNDHRPPHFHVRSRKWEIRVLIETTTADNLHYTIKWSQLQGRQPKPKTLQSIAAKVCEHRLALLDEWQRKVQGSFH